MMETKILLMIILAIVALNVLIAVTGVYLEHKIKRPRATNHDNSNLESMRGVRCKEPKYPAPEHPRSTIVKVPQPNWPKPPRPGAVINQKPYSSPPSMSYKEYESFEEIMVDLLAEGRITPSVIRKIYFKEWGENNDKQIKR